MTIKNNITNARTESIKTIPITVKKQAFYVRSKLKNKQYNFYTIYTVGQIGKHKH